MAVAALQTPLVSVPPMADATAFDRRALLTRLDVGPDLGGENVAHDANDARYETFALPPPSPDGFGRPEVEDALRRIVASDTFRHSERHRAFVAYVVAALLDGKSDRLKEVVIGLEVFGRQLNRYDPDRDSIVRVEARRLRRKLDQYYATEGANDPLEIRMPVGSYAPVVRSRGADAPASKVNPFFVVLPFQATGIDERWTGLSACLADLLVDRIGSDPALRVMAPMAARLLREQASELALLCHRHGIDYVIDGSIAAEGPRLRCIAHLSRTRDRTRLWSAVFTFDAAAPAAPDRDLFAFQDRIAGALSEAARIETGSV